MSTSTNSPRDDDDVIIGADGVRYRAETVVEVQHNTSRRRILAVAIAIIALLLLTVCGFMWKLATPLGAPDDANLPEGIEWVRSIYGWGPTPAELLTQVVDASVAPDGTIWTVSSHNTLVAFDPNGTAKLVRRYEFGGHEGQFGSIEGIEVADNGEIYLADFGQEKIQVVNSQGDVVRSWHVPTPLEVAIQGDRVAVATWNGVAITDTNGELIATWGTRGPAKDQFDGAHGIAFDEGGNVYVSDTQNRRIKKYSPDGRLLWLMPKVQEQATSAGVSISSDASGTIPYQIPSSMTFDSAGRLVLVDPFEFQIKAHDPENGEITSSYGEFGPEDGLFAYPTGIDYDPARDYFVVADTANNRLQIIRLPESGGNVISRVRGAISGPVWLCSIPLILLLVAAITATRARRKRGRSDVASSAVNE